MFIGKRKGKWLEFLKRNESKRKRKPEGQSAEIMWDLAEQGKNFRFYSKMQSI